MSKTKSKAVEEIALPESVKKAIEEQQARVWRLRNLIECVRNVAESSNEIDDFGAAISGLQDYAEDIHMALDAGEVSQRAEAIEREEQGAARMAALQAGDTTAEAEDTSIRQ
jgi:hypothetical protein